MPKTAEEKLSRIIHVLLNDADHLRLLVASSSTSISEWVRETIKERLDKEYAQYTYQKRPDPGGPIP